MGAIIEPVIPHLNLYRRHQQNCVSEQRPRTQTSEADEHKKGAQRVRPCTCPIYASGTLREVFRRVMTHETDWDRAREAVQPFLTAGSWDVPQPVPPPPVPSPDAPPAPPAGKTLITDAIDECLQAQEANHAAENTLAKYRTVLLGKDGLAQFAAANGLRYVEEFEPRLIRQMSNAWEVGAGTRRTKLSIVKPFFEQLVEDGVIATNPARIRQTHNRALRLSEESGQERHAFSDDELRRMLEGCRTYGLTPREWPKKKEGRQVVAISDYREYAHKYDGEDLADFIELSFSTGLRFMDVATFHISRLVGHNVRLRAAKNGNYISVRISPELEHTILDRARQHGPYIFGDPTGRKPHYVYLCWRNRLEKLWAATGPWGNKPTHHRFRHTFVRLLLERSTPVSVVAWLVGDSEATIRKHYSRWVPEFQNAVDRALDDVQAYAPRLRRGI
jgi:integrase